MNTLRRLALACTGITLFLPLTALAQTAPSKYTYATRYDQSGRVVGTIAPDPDDSGPLTHAAVRNTYDVAGRLTNVESGKLSTWKPEDELPSNWGAAFSVLSSAETTYDGLGRKVRETARGSDNSITAVTQYSYDSSGRLECTAVRMTPATYASLPGSACTHATAGANEPDRITKNVYDAAGQLVQVRKAVGTPLEQAYATYAYTANGKRSVVIDANGNRAEMIYDGFDRQIAWSFPSKTLPASFNGASQAAALSTTSGAVSSCAIGAVTEVNGISGPSSGYVSGDDCEKYYYDRNGNRAGLMKRDGSVVSYEYDALNRMTRKIVSDRTGLAATATRDVFYGYDLQGLQTYARFDGNGGEGVTNAYDGLGRLTSTSVNLDGQSRTLSFEYDANGNRIRMTWPDGRYVVKEFDDLDREKVARNDSTETLLSRAYNDWGLLQTADRAGSAFDQSFAYDGVGRLSNLGLINGTAASRVGWQFARNAASQITSEARDNDAYSWDGARNVDRNYGVNGLNQYTAAGAASFCYDANGNLTAALGTSNPTVYLYDVENRLVEVRAATASSCPSATSGYTGTLKASLRYDPQGRLYEILGNSSAATTRFLYDGDALTAEYDASGNLLKRYMHGNDVGADDPVIEFTGSSIAASAARHLYADPRGSIVLTGDAAGSAIAINSYDEYGIPGSANQGRFQYTGQAWLPEIGMYHYKARVYSPTLGRFLQTDPIGYDDQVNLYAYVANDPVNNVDPDGQVIETVWDVANIAMGVASAAGNVAAGNYGKAAVDVVGVVVDTAAAVVPGVPGGAGTAIKVARGAERVAEGATGGARAGKAFTRAGKAEVKRENASRHAGQTTCERCGNPTIPAQQHQKGVTPPKNETHVDHIVPKSKGGDGAPNNGQVLCRDCNLKKGDN